MKQTSTTFSTSKKSRLRSFCEKAKSVKFYMAIFPILWILLFFIFPLLIIFKISFAEPVAAMPPFTEIFSWGHDQFLQIRLNLHNYFSVIKDSYYVSAFLNSVVLSLASTAMCFLLGFMMAYGIYKVEDRLKTLLLLLVSLSFWTSFLIRIYAWMNLFSAHGFVNSLLMKSGIIDSPIQFCGNYYAVCCGMVFCYLPFMIFPVYAVLEKFDKTYIEAAYDLGASPAKTFWKVTIPLAKHGIAAGCILVFATSIGEFVIPELLGGSDTVMFGRVLWAEFFNNLDWPMACALAMVMMIFIILPVFVFKKKANI